MSFAKQSAAAIGFIAALAATEARGEGSEDAEIAALKRQLQLLETKLDKLQKQPTRGRRHRRQPPAPGAYAAVPVKGPAPPPDAIVLMPNNRPTICTYDQQNCVAITGRMHFDIGGYDYHPNTASTVPQRLDDGINVRRARIGVTGKFLSDWNSR